MKKIVISATALAVLAGTPFVAQAATTPEQDLKEFREHYMKRFPDVRFEDYQHGVYAINSDARISWEAIEEFPPYEDEFQKGKDFFNKKFANGKSLGSCFPNGGMGIRQNYPYFDAESGKIKTLEGEINACLKKNGEKELGTKKGMIAAVSSYMASTSYGKPIDIKIPDDPRALELYNRGKRHFYAKRGQLNLSCANCHVDNAGRRIRADTLSPALGHVSHFPVWRLKWKGYGTIQRRYSGCNKQVRAKPFKAQGDEYNALEYFHTYMSNGIKVNAPSTRK